MYRTAWFINNQSFRAIEKEMIKAHIQYRGRRPASSMMVTVDPFSNLEKHVEARENYNVYIGNPM